MKKSIAILLSVACSTTMLAGCSNGNVNYSYSVNETIMPESKWINSCLEKSIDETTKVSLKDDFYTAVNYDELLAYEKEIADNAEMGTMINAMTDLQDQIDDILLGRTEIHEPSVKMNQEDLNYDVQLIQAFGKKVKDWDTRNKQGVEALRPYIETIENIQTMDDLRAFVLNKDYQAICDTEFVKTGVATLPSQPDEYVVDIANLGQEYTLLYCDKSKQKTEGIYLGSSDVGNIPEFRDLNYADVTAVLTKLGYTEDDVKRIMKNVYSLETDLAQHSLPYLYLMTAEFSDEFTADKDLAYLESIQGDYPLVDVLKSKNYDKEDKFALEDDGYVRYVGSMFNEGNLEKIKSEYIVRTIYATQLLLDKDIADTYYDNHVKNDSLTESQAKEQEANFQQQLYTGMINKYLAGPLSTVYVSQYCSEEQKEDLSKIADKMVEEYREIFANEDWLTKSTKEKVLEKLDAIEKHILYPDEFKSYNYIQISENDSLLEMVSKINYQKSHNDSDKINTKVDRAKWDFEQTNTTTFNCYYNPQENAIYILAAFIAGGNTYNLDMTLEQKYAFSTVIGHEITHGFDTTGKNFDKHGCKEDWWSSEDEVNFDKKAAPLIKYYSSISPSPGSKKYDGDHVSGEAIADLGGMKCVLALAAKEQSFDYDAFFKAYAKLWLTKQSYLYADGFYLGDEHPTANLRINIVLSQFDEFIKTYDIQPGDGMYVEPKKRILVW